MAIVLDPPPLQERMRVNVAQGHGSGSLYKRPPEQGGAMGDLSASLLVGENQAWQRWFTQLWLFVTQSESPITCGAVTDTIQGWICGLYSDILTLDADVAYILANAVFYQPDGTIETAGIFDGTTGNTVDLSVDFQTDFYVSAILSASLYDTGYWGINGITLNSTGNTVDLAVTNQIDLYADSVLSASIYNNGFVGCNGITNGGGTNFITLGAGLEMAFDVSGYTFGMNSSGIFFAQSISNPGATNAIDFTPTTQVDHYVNGLLSAALFDSGVWGCTGISNVGATDNGIDLSVANQTDIYANALLAASIYDTGFIGCNGLSNATEGITISGGFVEFFTGSVRRGYFQAPPGANTVSLVLLADDNVEYVVQVDPGTGILYI